MKDYKRLIIKCGCWCFSLTLIAIQIYFCGKAVELSDEGWFLYLLRDCPSGLPSSWQYLFRGFFDPLDIRCAREVNLLFFIFSASILAIGGSLYNKSLQNGKTRWGFSEAFATILAGQNIVIGFVTIGYNAIILYSTLLSLGLILLALSSTTYCRILLVLAGIASYFILPAKITAATSIFVLGLFIWISAKNWRWLLFYVGGLVFGLVVWFSFLQSPSDYITTFQNQASKTIALQSQDYGVFFLLKWIKTAFVWHFALLMMGMALILTGRTIKNPIFRFLFFILFALYLFADGFLFLKGRRIGNPYMLYWTAFILFWLMVSSREKAYLGAVLFMMPVCLTFGTDNLYRYTYAFLSFITFGILFLSERSWQKGMLVVIIFLNLINLGYSIKSGSNMLGSPYCNQTIDIKDAGIQQDIKVDKTDFDAYCIVMANSSPGAECMCDMFSWGFVPMLELSPIRSDFRLDVGAATDSLNAHIARQAPLLILLYDTESDFGCKQDLIEYTQKLADVSVIPFGYENERTLIRYPGGRH